MRAKASRDGAREPQPIGTVVTDPLADQRGATGTFPAVSREFTAPAPVNPLSIEIDREAVRRAGYLPESSVDRRFADHYRIIKRPLISKALEASKAGNSAARLIMLGSALPGDGKTFTSINLALSMARERDVSVLLVDADVAKPHVSALFGAQDQPGLLDALSNAALDVEGMVLTTDVNGLSVLPAGHQQEGATEMLSSSRMQNIVSRLLAVNPRRLVVFDTPPILVSSESRALAAIAGQVVLVVRAGHTPQRAVLDALHHLGEDKDVSLVLNQGRIGMSDGYYGMGTYGSNGENPPVAEAH
jgi:protein-tyrosine kinase